MRYVTLCLALIIFGCTAPENSKETAFTYPESEKVDSTDTYFGTELEDPYRWLEDDNSEATGKWVAAQNDVTFDYLNSVDFRDKMKNRLRELLDYERVSAPFLEGKMLYWYKNDGLQNHSVLYRMTMFDNEEQATVYLDPNAFSEDGTVALRGVFFTDDGSISAHMITEGGSDWRKVIVMNSETKEVTEDTLINVKFSGISWKGNEGFYYSSYDNPESGSQLSGKTQYHKLYYHKLGSAQSADELVYGGEEQPNRYISGGVSEDNRFLIVSAGQNTSGSQSLIKDLEDPTGDFKIIQDDYFMQAYPIHTIGDEIYIYTNIDAPNYRLVRTSIDNPTQENWVDVIPETENVLSASTGGGKIFASYLIDAKTSVFQYDMDGKMEWEIDLPGIGSAFGFGEKNKAKSLYYTFSSFTNPSTIYSYSIVDGSSKVHKTTDVDFNPDDYETKQVFYTSKDGTKVPMFIVHKKGIELNGKNPTYLYGYGGFNISLRPSFSPYRVLWLENGGIYAQPNLRGGGEYGKKWHEAGTKMNKQNVFDDFIAAGEYLISENYTSSDFLTIAGGSNGGLLVGATITQRPELAKVALPAVGVLDMLRYHKFTAGAGWSADYGTSEDSQEMFEYLKKYSPYHALKPGTRYPATLVTTADHDDRVVPAHSFKFAARLQEFNDGPNPVMIRIQTDAGHGSVSIDQSINSTVDQYSFAWYNMGIIPEIAKKAF